MLVIVKSAPGTAEGSRGVKFARDMAADVLFVQSGAYFCRKDRLEGFCGTAYVLDADRRLRGIEDEEMEKNAKPVSYAEFVGLMADEEKVVGMF